MYITLDALRNMAKSKRTPSTSAIVSKRVTDYERQRQLNIENNNRKLQELGIPIMTSSLRTNEEDQHYNEEDAEYTPTEEERMHVDIDDVSLSHHRSTIRRPPYERQMPLIRSSSGHSTHVMSSDYLHRPTSDRVPRTRSTTAQRENDSNFSNSRGTTRDSVPHPNVVNEQEIPISDQGASSPKRGKTKCQSWKRKREVDPTKVEIEIPIELKRVVGKNSTQFVSEASYLMKQYMPLDVEKWDDIHADKKRKYFMKLKDMFKWPQGSHVDRAIERRCKVWYRKWRYDLRQKAYADFATVDDRRKNPPKEVDPEQWKWIVNYWDSEKFRRRSETNTKSQQFQKMLAKVGTKSIASTFYEMLQKSEVMCEDSNDETAPECHQQEEEPLYLQLWKIQRKKKDGTWSDELAEKKYEELKDLHQQQLEKYGVDNLTPHEAFTRVLKQRKGSHHQRGMGQGVIPYTCYEDQVINEVDIQEKIDAEVNRRVTQIHESYEARLRALEERLGHSSTAQIQSTGSAEHARHSSMERSPIA